MARECLQHPSLNDTACIKNHCIQTFFLKRSYAALLGTEICLCRGPFSKEQSLQVIIKHQNSQEDPFLFCLRISRKDGESCFKKEERCLWNAFHYIKLSLAPP